MLTSARQNFDHKQTAPVVHSQCRRHLAAVGYDPVYGARPVKRAIQRELETPLAQALLRGQFQVRRFLNLKLLL
jgi:ATP-dependent Clp protease ATP-binding subunit ClpB